ncbi:MAG: methyltransferase domain-containing protein [Actinomycetota bacterium]
MDEAKLNEFLGKIVVDAGAAFGSALVYVGDRLGLWKALADNGPSTPEQVAAATGTNARIVREWLSSQAAGGYVTYEPATGLFTLPEEHAAVLAVEDSPANVLGFFQVIASVSRDLDKVIEMFKTGRGLAWGDHHHDLFQGTERFFRPGYAANLVPSWIPALEGVEEKLREGITVADVGSGHGISTILMAKAYPNSRFVGFDFHKPSIERARKLAADEGVADRVTFEVARAQDYPGIGYGLIAIFDALHDMGDPAGAVRHAREAIADDGTILLVEPNAGDHLEDNLNPVGRAYYGASTTICTPSSLSEDGPGLGAQAGEARLRKLFDDAGFRTFRRAAATPFNLVLEAKP